MKEVFRAGISTNNDNDNDNNNNNNMANALFARILFPHFWNYAALVLTPFLIYMYFFRNYTT
jgi:hypothetical protein